MKGIQLKEINFFPKKKEKKLKYTGKGYTKLEDMLYRSLYSNEFNTSLIMSTPYLNMNFKNVNKHTINGIENGYIVLGHLQTCHNYRFIFDYIHYSFKRP